MCDSVHVCGVCPRARRVEVCLGMEGSPTLACAEGHAGTARCGTPSRATAGSVPRESSGPPEPREGEVRVGP